MPGTRLAPISCHLTDRKGNILNPYQPGAISYFIVKPGKAVFNRVRVPSEKAQDRITVGIKGYVSLFIDNNRITEPLLFRTYKTFKLFVPERSDISFRTVVFKCGIHAIYSTDNSFSVPIKVMVDTVVQSEAWTDLVIPALEESAPKTGNSGFKEECVRLKRIFHQCLLRNETTVTYREEVIKAEVYQYNAFSDGKKKTYTDEDELTSYDSRGIPDPQKVSYYALYINGVLQPRVNYDLQRGLLTLKTEDVPVKKAPLAISFVTLKNKNGAVIPAEAYTFNTVSDGARREYTDEDELKEYGTRGIIDPSQVSLINLFINGVLQPAENYTVHKGRLTLLTPDVPCKGTPIILEFITIREGSGRVLKASTYIYTAAAHDNRRYTNKDGLDEKVIPDPKNSSFKRLFINAVIQPAGNYSVQKGLLTLDTGDLPLPGSPVSLQFITVTSLV